MGEGKRSPKHFFPCSFVGLVLVFAFLLVLVWVWTLVLVGLVLFRFCLVWF